MTIQTNNKIALPKSFLQQESYFRPVSSMIFAMSLQEQGWCWEDYHDREGVLLIKSGVADNSGILLTNKKILV